MYTKEEVKTLENAGKRELNFVNKYLTIKAHLISYNNIVSELNMLDYEAVDNCKETKKFKNFLNKKEKIEKDILNLKLGLIDDSIRKELIRDKDYDSHQINYIAKKWLEINLVKFENTKIMINKILLEEKLKKTHPFFISPPSLKFKL